MCKMCIFARIVFIFAVIAAAIFLWNEAHGAEPSVRINEIAWMGTETSANDEWMELFNASDTAVDLAGWQLRAQDGSPDIMLGGMIPAGGYMLLERTDDSTIPTIAAHQIYTGSLGNDGEILELVDAQGLVQDTIEASGGWPAGDKTTKGTRERGGSGSAWHTGPAGGTPRAKNSSSVPPPPAAQEEEENIVLTQTYQEPAENAPSQQNNPITPTQNNNERVNETYTARTSEKNPSPASTPSILAGIGTNSGDGFAHDLQKNSMTPGIPPFFIAGGIVLALVITLSIGIVLAGQDKKTI